MGIARLVVTLVLALKITAGLAAQTVAAVSPDGKYVAYLMRDTIWFSQTTSPAGARDIGVGLMPTWAPDGSRLAYYSAASGSLQLWLARPTTGETHQLTHVAGGLDPNLLLRLTGWVYDPLKMSWSPDGTRLAISSQVEMRGSDSDNAAPVAGAERLVDSTAPIVLTNTTPPAWAYAGLFRHNTTANYAKGHADFGAVAPVSRVSTLPARRVSQLFLVDTRTGQLDQLTTDTATYVTPDWSPDGTTIVAMSLEGRPLLGYGPRTTNLYLIDVGTRAVRPLTHGPGSKTVPNWSPDGRWVAYRASRDQFALWAVDVVRVTNGEVTVATRQIDRMVWNFVWGADSRTLYVIHRDGICAPLDRVDMVTGAVTPVVNGVSTFGSLTSARDGLVVWEWVADPNGPTSLVAQLPHGGRRVTLRETLPAPSPGEYGRQEVVHWRNQRGEDLDGLLVYPVAYQPGRRYPMIVNAYSNNLAVPRAWDEYLQPLARRGYVIFMPNHRAPHMWANPMRNAEYDSAATGPHGPDVLTDDVLSGVDVLATRGVIDTTRMGLFGFSNGGGSVNYLVTRTDRFKCAVSQSAASTDWTFAFYYASGGPETVRALLGATPWDDPELYKAVSPVSHLDRVVTPMLMAAGDDEQSTVLMELEMYVGLRFLNRPVTFIRYPSQGHGFTGAAQQDWLARVYAFYDSYLHPER